MLLSDGQWERIAPLVPGKEGDLGRTGGDNRRFVEVDAVDRADWGALARSADRVRQMVLGVGGSLKHCGDPR